MLDYIETERLCIFYDAGETNGLLPLLKEWEKEGVDFKVLVMGTAETLIEPEQFPGRRLTLQDLEITQVVDTKTPRTEGLTDESLAKIARIKPEIVLTGSVSKMQEQLLKKFSDRVTVTFLDMFDYDPKSQSFQTVQKVQAQAKHLLVPSEHVAQQFPGNHEVHVVGKPSLDSWKEQITTVNQEEVRNMLGFDKEKPVITFIGGYGPGYEVINPLFHDCATLLRREGYQVIMQPHPKVATPQIKTIEALALSDYVVGYNSSVIFEAAAALGINAVYMIPENCPYAHFAIEDKLISSVSTMEALFEYIHSEKKPADKLQETVPTGSIQKISEFFTSLLAGSPL